MKLFVEKNRKNIDMNKTLVYNYKVKTTRTLSTKT